MPAIRESLNTNCSLCAVVWMSLQNLLKFNIVIVTVLGGESFKRWLGHGFTLMHGLTPYLGRRLVTLGVWPPFSLSRKLSLSVWCLLPRYDITRCGPFILHFPASRIVSQINLFINYPVWYSVAAAENELGYSARQDAAHWAPISCTMICKVLSGRKPRGVLSSSHIFLFYPQSHVCLVFQDPKIVASHILSSFIAVCSRKIILITSIPLWSEMKVLVLMFNIFFMGSLSSLVDLNLFTLYMSHWR